MAKTYNKDSMEVNANDIEIHGILGEGAFGIVKKGILKSHNKAVAVKMLKGTFIQMIYQPRLGRILVFGLFFHE